MQEVRQREREPGHDTYENVYQRWEEIRQNMANGKVIVKGKETPFQTNRQGRFQYYVMPEDWEQVAVPDWLIFSHFIQTAEDGSTSSGEHRHQGGLGLFILEGEGWSTVNGKKYPWKAGDFQMLPIQPDGCLHQHFAVPGTNARWLALIWEPHLKLVGIELTQTKLSKFAK